MRHRYLLLLPALACGPAADSPPSSGELAVQWAGSATGGFRAPATALWCARDTLLELFAVRNDTAVGITLLPTDSLGAGTYAISPPQVFVASRPQAGAAARWLDQIQLKGFEGASGTVTLRETGASGVSGSFGVVLRRTDFADSILTLSGSFSRVPVGKAIESCGRANRPGAA